jgi:hypothetical protein
MELYDLYSSANIIRIIRFRRMSWAGDKAHTGERGAYRALLEKRERNRPLGTPRLRWEDNIKGGLQEV